MLPARAVRAFTAFVLSSRRYWLGFVVLIFLAPGTGMAVAFGRAHALPLAVAPVAAL
jgi:hypothetical protein